MHFCQALPVLLLLAACSRAPEPCPTVTAPRLVTVLRASVISSGHAISEYRQEFATPQACEAARQQVRLEMDRLVERAKASVFNDHAASGGWTDYRGRYHPAAVVAWGEHSYPDLMATCSADAIAAQGPNEPNQPITLPEQAESVGGVVRQPSWPAPIVTAPVVPGPYH
jgi:hypothetical protein